LLQDAAFSICAASWSSKCSSPNRPTNCTPIGKPDGVAELRLIPGSYSPTIEGISAVIAHSQIVVARPYRAVSSLPAEFDYADIAVLDWIAAEGRRPPCLWWKRVGHGRPGPSRG